MQEEVTRGAAILASAALLVVACSGGAGGSGQAAPPPAPTCQCVCPNPSMPAPPAAAPSAELEALVASANRKMHHEDGPGCLADLDRVAAIDPASAARLVMVRAQCEMLSGSCQKGKQRVAAWYREELNMSQERANMSAEAIGSTRCRGGDSTPRDQLLVALHDLMDGAYINTKEASFCRDRLEKARSLLPVVKPAGPDDTQVGSAGKTLFNTAANCFARAGDCASAWTAYRDNFPPDSLASIKSATQRDAIMRESFRSTVARCSGAP